MAKADKLVIRTGSDLREKVERHGELYGHDSLSDAAKDLLEIGWQETRSPWLYRVKNGAMTGAYTLALIAVCTLTFGYATEILEPGRAIVLAMVFLTVATVPVAVVELAQAANGSASIRDVFRRVRL